MCVLLKDTPSFDYIAFLGTWETEEWQVFWLPKATAQGCHQLADSVSHLPQASPTSASSICAVRLSEPLCSLVLVPFR